VRYALLFAEHRGQDMRKPPPTIADILKAHGEGRTRDYTVKQTPGGGFEIAASGAEDHAQALEMIGMLTPSMFKPEVLAPPQAPAPVISGLTLGDGFRTFDQTEGKGLRPNTRDAYARAARSFMEKFGAKIDVAEITRPMAAEWAEDFLRNDLAKSTVKNYVSRVAVMFDTFIEKGRIKENPVRGVVKNPAREKKARRAQGFIREPFDEEQLCTVFKPENFARTRKAHVRWGAVIGLYTGARAGEIMQMYLRDFDMEAKTPTVKITAESEGQSVKTGKPRCIPIHPDLVRLGLLERVRALRETGEERLFPGVRLDGKAGPGYALVSGFSYLLRGLGLRPRRKNGTLGHHGFRKSVVGAFQAAGVSDDKRRAYLGHEPGDVHSINYMREWTPEELTTVLPALKWAKFLDFDKLRPLLETTYKSKPARRTVRKQRHAGG
jgi:integrase